jgi:hypothetical protein
MTFIIFCPFSTQKALNRKYDLTFESIFSSHAKAECKEE